MAPLYNYNKEWKDLRYQQPASDDIFWVIYKSKKYPDVYWMSLCDWDVDEKRFILSDDKYQALYYHEFQEPKPPKELSDEDISLVY